MILFFQMGLLPLGLHVVFNVALKQQVIAYLKHSCGAKWGVSGPKGQTGYQEGSYSE